MSNLYLTDPSGTDNWNLRVNNINSNTNTDLVVEGKGTGDVVLKTNNINRVTVADNGITTFSTLPECSAVPTTANQLVNKTYADGLVSQSTAISITDTNTNATFYPTFVSGSGTSQTLRADITTTPLSYIPSTGSLSFGSGSILTGNLNFATSTAQYITSNSMSDIQPANRFGFRSSFTNQGTGITISPNGTSSTSLITIHNNSDVANSGFLQLSINASSATVASSAIGTGTANNLILSAGGTTAQTINATTGVTSFGTIVPTCSTSASTTNQLTNYANFLSTNYVPTIISSGGGTCTYTTQDGRFVKIGNLCVFSVEVQSSSMASLNAGDLSISLPQQNNTTSASSFTVGLINGMNTASVYFAASCGANGNNANLFFKTGASANTANITKGDVQGGSFRVRIGGAYICAN